MNNLQSQFNSIAQCYDRQRTRLVPCFDDFYGIAIDNLNLSISNPKILDLGAGTGLMSDFVLQRYPEAIITLVDISDKMLDIARQRFASNTNITIICQDFSTFRSEKQYNAIISSLAIHHLEDKKKKELYKNIYAMLKSDGLFINAEQVEGEDSYFSNLNDKRWRQAVEKSDLTQDEIKSAYERVNLDKRSPLSSQLKWLNESGFEEVDCLYKYYDFTVIYCKK